MRTHIFRLQKWYCDLLTARGEFVFVYFADLLVLRKHVRSVTVHSAWGAKPITWTRHLRPCDRFEGGRGGLIVDSDHLYSSLSPTGGQLWIEMPGCSLRLNYVPQAQLHADPLIITHGGAGNVFWKPLMLGAGVNGELVAGDEGLPIADARGYADYVESDILPPRVRVRTLRWGRIHHPDVNVTFVVATGKGDPSAWTCLVATAGNRVLRSEKVNCEVDEDGSSYRLHACVPEGEVSITVEHNSILQEESFIDHQHWKSAVATRLMKVLVRNPRSTKWASTATVFLKVRGMATNALDVPMVDEVAYL